jgi:hypothetical protein
MDKKNRWYDNYPELAKYIEKMKEIDKEKRDSIIIMIKNFIIENSPDIIDKNVMDFPMGLKRRWYDKDPFSWLIINSLKYANLDILNQVTELIKKNL